MPGKWDGIMKRMLRESPQQFVAWLLGDGTYVSEVALELKSREIYPDALYKVEQHNKTLLLHIEFQSTACKNMAERLLEYNVMASRANGYLPVCSCVIYLKEDRDIPVSPLIQMLPDGREILRFNFVSVELWKMPAESILQTGLVGLFPLLTLTRDGKQPQIVDAMIEGLVSARRIDLLAIAYTMASLAFGDQDSQQMLKRRFMMLQEMLRESWAYQEIKQEGVEEERKHQRKQQRKQQREILLTLVQKNFPALVSLALQRSEQINSTSALQEAILQLLSTDEVEEARQVLENLSERDE